MRRGDFDGTLSADYHESYPVLNERVTFNPLEWSRSGKLQMVISRELLELQRRTTVFLETSRRGLPVEQSEPAETRQIRREMKVKGPETFFSTSQKRFSPITPRSKCRPDRVPATTQFSSKSKVSPILQYRFFRPRPTPVRESPPSLAIEFEPIHALTQLTRLVFSKITYVAVFPEFSASDQSHLAATSI